MASVTAHLMGGLGNQLFQIATAYAYAKRFHRSLIFLKVWPHSSNRPPVWDTYLDSSRWTFHTSLYGFVMLHESGFSFQDLPPPINNTQLYGYFQSSKYFSPYEDEIRSLLQVNDTLLKLYHIPSTVFEGYIGAHVRRGDYMIHPEVHNVCSQSYYTGARDYIDPQKPVFWITDDPGWVNEHMVRPGDTVLSSETVQDFTRLSQFKDIIMSNSSFSWWATWLNPIGHVDRKICCPNKWFGSKGPQDYATVYEPGWSKIDTISGKVVEQD